MYPLPDGPPLRTGHPRLSLGARIGSALAAALGATAIAVPMFAEAEPGLAPTAQATGCRPAGHWVQCSISVAFNPVEGATTYSATVSTPTGRVLPSGSVGAGSAALAIPYDGDGAYTVTVYAWGMNRSGQPEQKGSADADAEVSGKEAENGAPRERTPAGKAG
jgi:hypothetical protein